MGAAPQRTYEEAFAYLTDYVDEDWLGFSVLTGTAAQLLGPGADEESLRLMVLRLVDELLQGGARAGDLTSDPEPFRPWDLDRARTWSASGARWRRWVTRPSPVTSAG